MKIPLHDRILIKRMGKRRRPKVGQSSLIPPRKRLCRAIRYQIGDTTSVYDREKLQERLAKLVGGVAVIKVGAATELEMKEKRHGWRTH